MAKRPSNSRTRSDGHTPTVHPYTFVPLSRRTALPQSKHDEPRTLTGFIECEWTTRTPVAVPNQTSGETRLPFFRIQGKLAIPGSSLRGCVRSVYEALTDSCMRTNDAHFHNRSIDPKKPGLLGCNNGTYRLYPATRYRIDTEYASPSKEAGDKVRFDVRKSKNNTSPDWALIRDGGSNGGYFLRPNTFSAGRNKSHPSVFEKTSAEPLPVSALSVERLDDNIDLYDLTQGGADKGTPQRAGREYRMAFERMQRGDGLLPVWYENDGTEGAYSFAPSQISRNVLALTPVDFLKRMDLQPCTSLVGCCPACSLFGFVGPDEAKASRVRFSDALCTTEVDTDWLKLPPLLAPKMSAFEFYLRNDDNPTDFAADDGNTQLSGRKFYWHHQNGYRPLVSATNAREDLQDTVEAVPAGTVFTNRIFFDGVTPDELNNLVYALSLSDAWSDSDPNGYCLKIGHGKAVGLGSVQVKVKQAITRECDGSSYHLKKEESWKQGLAQVERRLSHTDIIKRIMAFDTVPADKTIEHPNLQWFQHNHTIGSAYKEVLQVDGQYGYRCQDKTKPVRRSFGDTDDSKEVDPRWAALSKLKFSDSD